MPDSTNLTTSAPGGSPYLPCLVETRCYYYGLPSQPHLLARSSSSVWKEPSGPEAYLTPKELRPFGRHPLEKAWEAAVGPAIVDHLNSEQVNWTSIDPVRIGFVDDDNSDAIVWLGVEPKSLSAERGLRIATHCKQILSIHNISDVDIEIRESTVTPFTTTMYKPLPTAAPASEVREPFSTTLGLPICAESTPYIEGTGGFYISDPRFPSKLYLITAKHVVFSKGQYGMHYEQNTTSQPRRNIHVFGDDALKKSISAIEREIQEEIAAKEHLEKRLEYIKKRAEDEYTKDELTDVSSLSERSTRNLEGLMKFLATVSKDWPDYKSRILGHVSLAPPISVNVEDSFTEDWAVIEVSPSMVQADNFVGNAIDLGTKISVGQLTRWMYPVSSNLPTFKYPHDRLLKLVGTIPDEEIWRPSPHSVDQDNDPCLMVLKRGNTSGLTVGRPNGIRSVTRRYLDDQPAMISKELSVLPRNSKSGPFSMCGDSGSVVVDGKGRIAGLLTGGAGATNVSDCTYVTSYQLSLEAHGATRPEGRSLPTR